MKVYRIPLKRVYKKKPGWVEGDPTWNDLYGKMKCGICKQHFKEGEPYTVIQYSNGKSRKLICGHVECVEKHGAILDTGGKSKKLPGLRKKTGRLSDRQKDEVGKSIRTKKPVKRPVRRPV